MSATPEVTGDVTLSNSFLGETIQVCLVTKDYRRTMEGLVKAGIGPWRVFTFSSDNCKDMKLHGKPARFSFKLCMAFSGSMFWEIVQPLEGESIYTDFLERHGEGVHHVAFDCNGQPWEERVASFEKNGFPCIQSGVWEGKVNWAYFGTEEATGTIFEIYDIPEDFVIPEPEYWYPAPPPSA